jgi:nucleoid-associated protein YgaU
MVSASSPAAPALASTSLQNYLYANNKPISQAAGNQSLVLKKLTLQGGQPIQAPIDPITGEQAASTGGRLSLQESDIARTAGVIDRAATARNIAARAYAGDPGFAQLSTAAQDKVAAYVLAQLPPDAEIVAGAQVTLHSFILMVDASYTGLSQITDYSLRQLGSDGIPGGSVQSHVVRAGDTLQTIAQIYFGSPAYWYLIADANGLSGSEQLAEGVTLTIPNSIANSANSAQTFKVYNESEVIGSTSPEIRTVAKKKKWYQKLIQILIIVILVIAVIVTAGAALAIAGAATPGLLALGASLATSVGAVGLAGGAAFAAAAAIGAAVYATASILTQGLAVAAGLQESFSWKAVGKAAVTGAVSGGAGFLAAPLAGANAYSASNVALRVGIEAGKQVILDGKITNVAGLVGAAASGGAFKDMGESGSALQAAGNFASNNSATFGAGLALLESKVRGQGNNAMQWVALATAAAFDSGALSAGGDSPAQSNPASRATSPQYFTSGGEMNWRVVAAQAIGTAIVSNRMGSEAAIGYFGNAVGEFAVQAGGRYMDDMKSRQALYGLSSGSQQGLRLGGGTGLSYGGLRASDTSLLDNSSSDYSPLQSPSFDRFESGPMVAGPGGAPSQLVKVGASAAWKGHQEGIYNALDDLNAALSMGNQDPARLAELRKGALDSLNYRRIAMQTDPAVMQEILNRGLTSTSDLDKLGMLGAFGDSDTVHRIAVATAQAGGAGSASAQGISSQLAQLDGFGPSFVNRIPGDMSVEAAAPGMYLNTLLGMRSHVDSTMLYVASMSGDQMTQLGSYTDTVMAQGGMARHQDNEKLAGLFSGMQTTGAGMARVGEGLSVASMGLRNFGASLGKSIGSMNPEMLANSTIGKMLNAAVGPMYVVQPGTSLKGGNNPAVQAAASRGSTLHSDKPGNLPDQLRAMYPNTVFGFTKPGVAGQDVQVVSGTHPSQYPGATWPTGVVHADFKPGTPSGARTFAADQRLKWSQPTYMLPYDPKTGLLK